MKAWAIVLLMLSQSPTTEFPRAEIANGRIRATMHLPNAESGYYRGTRFDWSGAIDSLTWNGHEYFGRWFERHDPKIHDAITGPVEEFLTGDSALGYEEAKAGGTFVRIGVGVARKPDDSPYKRFDTYDIVDPGSWTVNRTRDRIEFIHSLRDGTGYAYSYRKELRLDGDRLILEHSLKNTGTKAIKTYVYNHNFFMMDRQTTGPDIVVRFPFAARAARDLGDLAALRSPEMVFLKPFEPKQTVFTEVEGFGATAKDYDFRIENRRTGAGVRITGDRPLVKVYFWSASTTTCPEPYIDVSVEPGRESNWKTTYEFYQVTGVPPAAKRE